MKAIQSTNEKEIVIPVWYFNSKSKQTSYEKKLIKKFHEKLTLWAKESGKAKWKIQKIGRTITMYGKTATIDCKFSNEAYNHLSEHERERCMLCLLQYS